MFVFGKNYDRDTIMDFADGVDHIDLSGLGFATTEDALALAHESGVGVVFLFGNGDRLIVKSFAFDHLDSGDIIIFSPTIIRFSSDLGMELARLCSVCC